MVTFEVIEIVDDNQPYLALMGLEWEVDNQPIINLKRREMIFEVGDLKVIVPLDPSEGKRYTKSVRKNDMENLYNLTTLMEDYVEPTMDGFLSWRSFNSCASDIEVGLENWQKRMHEVSTRRYVCIKRSLCWIGTKIYDPSKYDRLTEITGT
jgi:hypothetical protein